MLAGVLLHMVAAARGIHAAVDLGASWERRGGEMKNATIFFIRNFDNGNLPAFSQQHTKIMYLAAAGGIERGAVKNNRRPAAVVQCFHDTRIKVVEKRIVIVEPFR